MHHWRISHTFDVATYDARVARYFFKVAAFAKEGTTKLTSTFGSPRIFRYDRRGEFSFSSFLSLFSRVSDPSIISNRVSDVSSSSTFRYHTTLFFSDVQHSPIFSGNFRSCLEFPGGSQETRSVGNSRVTRISCMLGSTYVIILRIGCGQIVI